MTQPPQKPPIRVTAIVLTPAEERVLRLLIAEATDTLGRKISASAVVRAMIRGMTVPTFRAQILPLIEQELTVLHHGRRKKSS